MPSSVFAVMCVRASQREFTTADDIKLLADRKSAICRALIELARM